MGLRVAGSGVEGLKGLGCRLRRIQRLGIQTPFSLSLLTNNSPGPITNLALPCCHSTTLEEFIIRRSVVERAVLSEDHSLSS